MTTHIDALSRLELSRSHMVKKDERASHGAALSGQDSADDEAAQIALPRTYQV